MSGQDTTEKTDLPSHCVASLLKHCAALWNSSCNNSLLQRTSIRFKLVTNTLFLVALPTLDDTFATLTCHVSALPRAKYYHSYTSVGSHPKRLPNSASLMCTYLLVLFTHAAVTLGCNRCSHCTVSGRQNYYNQERNQTVPWIPTLVLGLRCGVLPVLPFLDFRQSM